MGDVITKIVGCILFLMMLGMLCVAVLIIASSVGAE
jgi:hypothetical protein